MMAASGSWPRWLGPLLVVLLFVAFYGGVPSGNENRLIEAFGPRAAAAAAGTDFYLPWPGEITLYVVQGQGQSPTHSAGGAFEYAWDFSADPDCTSGEGQSIVAIADGVVRIAQFEDFTDEADQYAWGCWVVIEHNQVEPKKYSLYAHLQRQEGQCLWGPNLKLNEKISQGQEVGKMGSSGDRNGWVHLHFQFQNTLTGGSVDGQFTDSDPDFVDSKPYHHTWVTSANPGGGIPASTNVDVALIVDSSGSMSSNDPAGKRKDAARAYLTASLVGDRVAVVDFDTIGKLAHGLADARAGGQPNPSLVAAIQSIDSSGMTNIRQGIEVACSELVTQGQSARRGAILLTDGQHNQGPFGNPQACFAQADRRWPIFAFGFGGADMGMLGTIAADTGGTATHIANVTSLVCEFQQIRSLIAGEQPQPCTVHNVEPGGTTSFYAAVPPGQAQATFSTSWAGSDVVMTLITPSGRVIDRDTTAEDVTHDLGPTFEVYGITLPEAGDWEVRLFGADVPAEGEEVVFGFSSLPVTVVTVAIDIDIKPGEDPNPINLGSRGVTPVAVLTTDSFDASSLDPATVQFADSAPLRWAAEDVDGDGDVDEVFQFSTRELNLDEYSTLAALSGLTFDGLAIYGTDTVKIVP